MTPGLSSPRCILNAADSSAPIGRLKAISRRHHLRRDARRAPPQDGDRRAAPRPAPADCSSFEYNQMLAAPCRAQSPAAIERRTKAKGASKYTTCARRFHRASDRAQENVQCLTWLSCNAFRVTQRKSTRPAPDHHMPPFNLARLLVVTVNQL